MLLKYTRIATISGALLSIGTAFPAAAQTSAGSQITLPIEVFGPKNGMNKVQFIVPPSNDSSPVTSLNMRMHGLEYTGQASVEVNSGPVIPINNNTVTITGPGYSGKFGGIGGPVTLFDLSIPLSAKDAPTTGSNTITFFFNGTNGNNSGYRVLSLNFLRADGTSVLRGSEFREVDPSTWLPPLNDAADIAAGKKLYTSGTIYPALSTTPMLAHCADCHSSDGRDLSYFNYSNNSIINRSEFHGLSQKQGEQIASYIRSLPYASEYGRPWNPPFQPGPGLDARGPSQWSAGAGIDAVLPDDIAMKPYLFPNGMNISVHDRMNVRDIPITYPLLDWNHWLPTTAPQDIWANATSTQLGNMFPNSPLAGTEGAFEQSHIYIAYQLLRKNLEQMSGNQSDLMSFLSSSFRKELNNMMNNDFALPKGSSQQVYTFALWRSVKLWEIQEGFGLDTLAPQVSLMRGGKPGNVQSVEWFGGVPFSNSPFRLHVENKTNTAITGNILGDGYLASAWYNVQLIVNPGDGISPGFNIIDWGYMPGPFMWMGFRGSFPTEMLITEMTMKSMQLHDAPTLYTGVSGQKFNNWHPWWAGGPGTLLYYFPRLVQEPGLSDVVNAVTNAWIAKNAEFTPAEWNEDDISKKGGIEGAVNLIQNNTKEGSGVYVNNFSLQTAADWAQTVWQQIDWQKMAKANATASLSP